MMPEDDLEEWLALKCVGALGAAEEARIEALLAEHPEWHEAAREMQETSAFLAYLAPPVTPPPELKHRILNAIDRGIAAKTPSAAAAWPSPEWLPWAMAALFVVMAGVTMLRNVYGPQIAAGHPLRHAHLRPPNIDSTSSADVDWDTTAENGTLRAHLPPAPAGCCYEIWIVAPGRDEPVAGGVFEVAADGSAEAAIQPSQPVAGAEHFLISLEKAGGVKVAQGPMVLAGS